MFGRVRVSSSSPDELERPTAKLLKHDSLSIYGNSSSMPLSRIKCGSIDFVAFCSAYLFHANSGELPSGKCLPLPNACGS